MRNLKKIIALILAVISLVSLVGCKDDAVVSKEKKEFSIFLFNSTKAYSPDDPVWKYAEEKTNVRLVNVIPDSASSAATAYNTMLADGILPDIIATSTTDLRNLAKDGGVIDLTELIDKYAPNLKKFFDENPDAKSFAGNDDGKIWFIPCSITDMQTTPSKAFIIRQDWLDKLGLKVPTTIEEYHDVLVAFKTQDPNGNGLADEIPFFSRGKTLDGITAMYGITVSDGVDKNGKYYYAPVTEAYKEAMKTAAQWRKEGLIDEEIFTRSNAREELFGLNRAGATFDMPISTLSFNETFAETVPGINLRAMLPIKNKDGEIRSVSATAKFYAAGAWSISSSTSEEDRITLIKYMDFFMSDEGRDLMSYGVEGLSYTKDENGNVVWSDTAKAWEKGVQDYLSNIGALQFIGTVRRGDVDTSLRTESSLEAYEMYKDIVGIPYIEPVRTDEEQKRFNQIRENIQTEVAEQRQRWFYGKEDVDATWDKYMEKLKSMGIEDYVNIRGGSYERMFGK